MGISNFDINEKHVFLAFKTLEKLKIRYWSCSQLCKNEKHVFGAFKTLKNEKHVLGAFSYISVLSKIWNFIFFKNSEISMILSSDIASSMYAMNLVDGALETLDPQAN